MKLDLQSGDREVIDKKGKNEMKETMIVNCVSIVAGSIAIAVACKVTKSALPLFAFILVPTFSSHGSVSSETDDKETTK